MSDSLELGQVAYEGYVVSCDGKSIHGEPLPTWYDQAPEIRAHWLAAADAVIMFAQMKSGPAGSL